MRGNTFLFKLELLWIPAPFARHHRGHQVRTAQQPANTDRAVLEVGDRLDLAKGLALLACGLSEARVRASATD